MELYIALAILSVVLSLTIGIHIYQSDKKGRYKFFVLVMTAAAIWSFFSIFWLLLQPPFILIAYKLSFLGVISLPVLLFLSSYEYTGKKLPNGKPCCYHLWIIPLISLLMVVTNPLHGLFWKEISPSGFFEGILLYQYKPGIWYWIHTTYSYLMIVGALVIFFRYLLKRKRLKLFFFIFLGVMVPIVANFMIITGMTQIDYTPIMLSFAGVGFGWTISVGFYSENIKTLESLQSQTSYLNALYNIVVKNSEKLIQTEAKDLPVAISQSLESLGRFTQVDRSYVFEYDATDDKVNNTFEWCNEGIIPEINNLQQIPYSFVPRWRALFEKNEHVHINSVSELFEEDRLIEKSILEPQGIQSLIVVPMFLGRVFVGFMGFDSVRQKKTWDDQVIALLRMAGNIIGGSIMRVRYESLLIAEKQRAETANRAKSEFLANMSHELRTPLNAVLGFSRIAADDTHEEETRGHLEIVINSGNSLLRLINDLLDFSKIEAGMLKLQPAELQLKKVLDFVYQTFITQVEDKNIELHVDLGEGTDSIFILDESRLRQVLFNLVGNAVKFTHHGGVDIRVMAVDANTQNGTKQLIFEVADTGIGIPESEMTLIFDSFNQLSRGDGRRYEGAGLGLNISRRLVEMMNGRIEVVSTEGKGSTFRIILPEVKIL